MQKVPSATCHQTHHTLLGNQDEGVGDDDDNWNQWNDNPTFVSKPMQLLRPLEYDGGDKRRLFQDLG